MSPSFEYRSSDHPSSVGMWGDFESGRASPERKETTPEEIRKTREYGALTECLYRSHAQIETAFRKEIEKNFDLERTFDMGGDIPSTTDKTALLGWDEASYADRIKTEAGTSRTGRILERSHPRIEKQTKSTDAPWEKEKLATYAELSDLAYVDFVTVPEASDPSKTTQEVSKVHLDPLAFPNFKTITEGKIPEKPTEDERIILSYLQEHKNDPSTPWTVRARNEQKVAPDIADLLHLAYWPGHNPAKAQYASLDEQYQTTMIDANPKLPRAWGIENNEGDNTGNGKEDVGNVHEWRTEENSRMIDAMEHLRTIKEKRASETLDMVKSKGFEIMDYFPNETRPDESSSGFGATCLKDKEDNIHFAIRWTELTDWGDIVADMRLIMKHVPENQTQDMITFFERNLKNLPENQKVSITGHSLGGALAQVASVMYHERVGESYTFNSPWAKGLSIDPDEKPEIIKQKFEKFRDFEYNTGSNGNNEGNEPSVESRMTNVRWNKWPSIIANLGEDIGDYEIRLEKLESHSITKLVEYLNALDSGSPELIKRYVGGGKKKEERDRNTTR